MDLIKKYFLLVAKRPVAYVFWTVFAIYIVIRFGVGVFYAPNNLIEKETASTANIILLFVSLMIFIVVAWINDSIVRAKITVLRLEPNEMGVMLYPNNKAEIYEKPVWGKHPINIVTFPEKWDWRTEKGEKKEVEIGIKIKINKTVSFLIPMKIKFIFSGPFQLDELRQKLQIDDSSCLNKTSTNIKKLVLRKFQEFNNGSSHDLIQGDLINYLNSEVSMQGLTDSIKRRISFPKNLFANVEKTDIEVLDPKFRFSKRA